MSTIRGSGAVLEGTGLAVTLSGVAGGQMLDIALHIS